MLQPRRREAPIDILLVEDNPGDIRLTHEALKEGGVRSRLTAVADGEEALALLRRQGPHAEARRPDLVLLDLNLPRMDGRELLAELKSDPELQAIPVIVLTTSNAEQDVLKAYALRANCYIIKPLVLEEFIAVVKSIEDFWSGIVALPTRR